MISSMQWSLSITTMQLKLMILKDDDDGDDDDDDVDDDDDDDGNDDGNNDGNDDNDNCDRHGDRDDDDDDLLSAGLLDMQGMASGCPFLRAFRLCSRRKLYVLITDDLVYPL